MQRSLVRQVSLAESTEADGAESSTRQSTMQPRFALSTLPGKCVGLLPLVKGMPLRITQTILKQKDKGLFKSTRGELFGWTLRPVDEACLASSVAELVLQYVPQRLFVFPGAQWAVHADLGEGIIGIDPLTQIWSPEKKRASASSPTWFSCGVRLQRDSTLIHGSHIAQLSA